MTTYKLVNGEKVLMTAAEESAYLASLPPVRVPSYREKRAIAYRDELGKEQGDFNKTIGDVLDVLIAQLNAAVPAASQTPEFKAVVAKVNAIKARFPAA